MHREAPCQVESTGLTLWKKRAKQHHSNLLLQQQREIKNEKKNDCGENVSVMDECSVCVRVTHHYRNVKTEF